MLPGYEVFCTRDAYGLIRVLEDGPYRTLCFDSYGEQSAVDLTVPPRLVFDYTQAMILGLCFVERPRHVTLFGLGGGSLVNSLLRFSDSLRLRVVELRPAVVEVAHEWMGLERSDRLETIIDDARHYVESKPIRSDLLFVDLFDDEGALSFVYDEQFLLGCRGCLTPNGVLVLNLWEQHKGDHPSARRALWEVFGDGCVFCPLENGNLIAYAVNQGPIVLNHRRLVAKARPLVYKLDINLNQCLSRLREA